MNQDPTPPTYRAAGVDEQREQDVFARAMRPWLARTRARSPLVGSISGLESGYFATLLRIPPGPPLALSTDGVGTKILVAREANRWEPIGVDCVANNVNDIICVGAVPVALLDYVATDRIDEGVLEEIARGLYLGVPTWPGSRSPGVKIAQIRLPCSPTRPAVLARCWTWSAPRSASCPRPRPPWTARRSARATSSSPCRARACTATATRWPGTSCSDLAGMTLADRVPGTARATWTTRCCSRPASTSGRSRALWEAGVTPRGLQHISGGGLLNLEAAWPPTCPARTRSPCRPRRRSSRSSPRPVRCSAATMYATFNMGTGFCIVVPPAKQQAAIAALKSAGEEPARVGWVTSRPGHTVSIPSAGLRGRGDTFGDTV